MKAVAIITGTRQSTIDDHIHTIYRVTADGGHLAVVGTAHHHRDAYNDDAVRQAAIEATPELAEAEFEFRYADPLAHDETPLAAPAPPATPNPEPVVTTATLAATTSPKKGEKS